MKQKGGTYAEFLTLLIKLNNLKTIVAPILKIVVITYYYHIIE
jgi:hypothetical protein